ncbi:SNARE associated Golgi protein [Macleaya cordata]|uniref:SNARE associated Golgi protein n=1 Tax=Macleaya cordata TaxID=56857 RepID=A0A200QB96_MACCD|nr:SNARE associated Golgi protein [Macleaya cordata]
MTFDDNEVAPLLKLRMGDGDGDYVRLRNSNEIEEYGRMEEPPSPRKGISWCWWLKMGLLCLIVIAVGVVFLIWVGPFLLNKEVIPILDWEMATFSPQVLGFLLFASLTLFPSLLIPSSPSMWVAGISFGYGFGFLLILAGLSIGMSLPYFIGSLFHHKIHVWLEKWPEKAAIIRLAGEGDWFHQFRAVVLLRISPFPFIIFNYASVATNVKYCPYIFGSLVGVVPEIFVSIYSGILIRSLADATQGHRSLSTPQIIYNAIGFCLTVAVTVFITIYAKRTLKKLQNEEETLLM